MSELQPIMPATLPEVPSAEPPPPAAAPQQPLGEIDGPRGPEPTRFGDWEKDGRCSDF